MLTRGFDPALLEDHFLRHGPEFGAKTQEEYEQLADTFLGGPLPEGVRECYRNSNRDRLRYNPATNEFGAVSPGGVIRTFYHPNRRRHRMVSNLAYFEAECRQ